MDISKGRNTPRVTLQNVDSPFPRMSIRPKAPPDYSCRRHRARLQIFHDEVRHSERVPGRKSSGAHRLGRQCRGRGNSSCSYLLTSPPSTLFHRGMQKSDAESVGGWRWVAARVSLTQMWTGLADSQRAVFPGRFSSTSQHASLNLYLYFSDEITAWLNKRRRARYQFLEPIS